jgi:hypothetical protein
MSASSASFAMVVQSLLLTLLASSLHSNTRNTFTLNARLGIAIRSIHYFCGYQRQDSSSLMSLPALYIACICLASLPRTLRCLLH